MKKKINKIKIIHVYKSFYPETVGGIEKFIDMLCSGLSNKFDFSLFCLGNKTESYYYKKIKIFKFKKNFEISSCPFSAKAILNFKKILYQHDIVHYHYPYPFMDLLDLISKSKKKSIVTYHSDIVKQNILNFFYNPLRKYFFEKQKKIIATTQIYAHTSNILKKICKSKIHIIPFGVKEYKLRRLNRIFKYKYVMFLGSIRYYKGIKTLIDAAQYTKHKIVICGDGKDLSLLKKIKEVKKLKNLEFTGYVNDELKNNLLRNCELFIFPSNTRSEAFGIAMLEAMSHGKPLISCEIGSGTSFLNINNHTGFVIEPNSPKLLADKINFLMDPLNKRIKKNFSINSKERFKLNFNYNKMIQSYAKLYFNL
jgi:glycosyltransferase involved in cell wall biosynthesis